MASNKLGVTPNLNSSYVAQSIAFKLPRKWCFHLEIVASHGNRWNVLRAFFQMLREIAE